MIHLLLFFFSLEPNGLYFLDDPRSTDSYLRGILILISALLLGLLNGHLLGGFLSKLLYESFVYLYPRR
jgi:hypothetical protein